MDTKQTLRKDVKIIKKVKVWQLFIILVIMSFVSATLLRMNNTGMIQRRAAVESADKNGDSIEIANRIFDLRDYASKHMNASAGTIYLQNQYNRNVRKAVVESNTVDNNQDTPQARADAVCNPHLNYRGYSQAYQDCIIAELSKGEPTEVKKVKLPSPSLYRHEIISPIWTPDAAGWSIVACLFIVLIIVVRIVSMIVLKIMLKHQYKSV